MCWSLYVTYNFMNNVLINMSIYLPTFLTASSYVSKENFTGKKFKNINRLYII